LNIHHDISKVHYGYQSSLETLSRLMLQKAQKLAWELTMAILEMYL